MTTASNTPAPLNEDSMRGFAFAMTAYFLWGFLPIYLKALEHVSPAEVIAHRIVWSLPIAGAVLWALGRTADIRLAIRSPRMIAMAALTAALISINWGIFVWAISAGHTLDAALGYYINPLFSILLGALLLKEKLALAQMAAIGLAAVAVAVMTVEAGHLPLVALGLTMSWGAYAFFKKMLPIGPNQGFFLEVLILAPVALGYMIYLYVTGTGQFLAGDAQTTWLLLCAGLTTAVPLILYANGAKLLKLSTIGIMQYVAPTMVFLIAVFVFGEPFGRVQLIAFSLIWAALALFSLSMLHSARGARRARGLRGG